MESLACLNGELVPVDQAKIPVSDRGFLFGDSVYEVFRLYQGRCWLEPEHMARLERSLALMQYTGVDLPGLLARVHRTIQVSEIREGTAYIQITRGVAPRLHAFPNPPVPPTELILIRAYDDAPTARLRESGVPAISQDDLRWKRCDVKSTNLLANVLANQAARSAGAYEAIFITPEDVVTEATHSSLLWVRDGHLYGTPEGPGILPGTTRSLLLHLAVEINAPFEEATTTLPDLKAADEVLLLGTTIEVLPVIKIDHSPIANGRPGPLSRRLQTAFSASVNRWLSNP